MKNKNILTEKKDIKNHFEFYKNNKIDEYFGKFNGKKLRGDSSKIPKGMFFQNIRRGGACTIVSKKIVKYLTPDKINSSDFWKEAVKTYPYLSICGAFNINSIKDANDESFNKIHIPYNAIKILNEFINRKSHVEMLEIGPGYGCIKDYVEKDFDNVKYHAIDVNPLFKHPRMFKTDGKTIPNTIPKKLDLVYSINVFQHLSPTQRTSYYKQIDARLQPGGIFIFSMFIVTPENENVKINAGKNKLFGFKDRNKNYYCSFFTQLTKIDRIEELIAEFKNYNMTLKVVKKSVNSCSFVAVKNK